MMSHCKNNFNDVLFPKHWKVLAFVISFSVTGAKILESMSLLSSWCDDKRGKSNKSSESNKSVK